MSGKNPKVVYARKESFYRLSGLGIALVLVIIAVIAYSDNKASMNRDHVEPFEDKALTAFAEQLWELDENRLNPNEHYVLDLQGKTKFSYDGPDNAAKPLFSKVDPKAFERPTYKAFIALLDNYESATGVAETVTPQEEKENWTFIDLVFNTKVMDHAYKFLKYKGKADQDLIKFKHDFYNLWFQLYKRSKGSRENDSSGFEHVFVGETRGQKEVIGFHNWIQFYLQEKAGNVDYKGFMSSSKNPHILSIQFSWKGDTKPLGSTLIGVSPEFEIALYTVCHLLGYDSYKITLGKEPVIIKSHKIGKRIGACYPQLPSWTDRRK
ncbi:uridylate-specific endoribonuclease B [Hydra vulgaris]|uniref:Uridylate-specific endoribonuclease n=1 Tax=Hydra vulgaris TaxID=6087 RepID=A0ABM4D739_HYDVU